MTININEQHHRVIVEENVVRVISVAVQGPEGIAGEQGEPGPQGETGLQGPIGEQGPKGDQGDPGPVGPQGEQGIQGIQGETGPEGLQGIQGEPGEGGGASLPRSYVPARSTNHWGLPGWYYTTRANGSNHAANRLGCVPIFVAPDSPPIIAVGCHVGTAAGITRMGLYSASAEGGPQDLVADFGTVDTSTTGQKTIELNEPLILQPGLYWTCISSSAVVSFSHPNNINGSAFTALTPLILSGPHISLRSDVYGDVVTNGMPLTVNPADFVGAAATPIYGFMEFQFDMSN